METTEKTTEASQYERYHIKSLIGEGAFSILQFSLPKGKIYKARDLIQKIPVAIKVENPEKSKHILIYESQVLQHLQGIEKILINNIGYPHMCKYYEFVQGKNSESLSYIVMELLGIFLNLIK